MSQYDDWIRAYRERVEYTLGKCMRATKEMVEAFPELQVVRGHVWCCGWGKRGHVWCVTADGEIVDPTADQFDIITHYEPWEPGDEVRVGKCMNCGDEIWKPVETLSEEPPRHSVCSDECGESLTV